MADLKWLNIPAELRMRRQWSVATLEPLYKNGRPVLDKRGNHKVDKAPRSPLTGYNIDPTDESQWCTFEECLNAGYKGIGYNLSAEDPFTIIDLDNKPDMTDEDRAAQRKVFELFPSYSEMSVSGQGLHIVVYGQINGGFNRGGIEIYDQERFMLFTGNTVTNYPIALHQDVLTQLASEMGYRGKPRVVESAPEAMSDDEILSRLLSAKNSEKFKDLYYRPVGPGDDWSRRDASLAQMIAFYTRNHEQALRLFRKSALYRPNGGKGKNTEHYEQYYLLEKTFGKAWEHERANDADIAEGDRIAQQLLRHHAEVRPPEQTVHFPPGLVGEVAEFVLKAAPRPVPEVALAGALAFCSGLLGRQYNISRTGLNLYVVLIAMTGRGKEAAASGIDALMSALVPRIPAISQFRGPGSIASGQALIRSIDESPSMFSFLSEFGHLMEIVTNPRANAADIRTRQALLDLFSKSGRDQSLQPTAYADKEKNTKAVRAPCFAFMGDTTPGLFYEKFSSDLMAEGLLPRFLTITYDGPRVPTNRHPIFQPSQQLVEHLESVVTSLINMAQSNTFVDIQISPAAAAVLDEFDIECDNRINLGEPDAEIWNRAHLKVLRLSGLVAVGKNHFNPIVEADDAKWAVKLVRQEIDRLNNKSENGQTGSLETRQVPAVIQAAIEYLQMPPNKRASYASHAVAKAPGVIPYSFFNKRFRMRAEFTKDRMGATMATKRALQDAIDSGYLMRLSDAQRNELKAGGQELYTPGAIFPQIYQ